MFYADREFLHRFAVPAAVSGYGSTEAGGVSHLHRWTGSTDDIPDDASRHGGAGRARHRVAARRRRHRSTSASASTPHCSTATSPGGLDPARDADGWFDTGDLGRADGAGPPGVPRARRRVDPGQGRVRPDPVRREPPGRRRRARPITRSGSARARSSTTRSCSTPSPTRCRSTQLRARIAELPAFMRPVRRRPGRRAAARRRRRQGPATTARRAARSCEWVELA